MRKLELIIKNCGDCPYLEYDYDYSMSRDSGYDCTLMRQRLIDDQEITRCEKKGIDPFKIPNECPLPGIDVIRDGLINDILK